MILKYNSFLGYQQLQSVAPTPIPSGYSGLKVFGECEIDNIHFVNYTMTDEQVSEIDYTITPTWNSNKTIFLATFDRLDLKAGNVIDLNDPILNWILQRRKSTETNFTTLATLPASTISYVDTLTESNVSYVYQLLATNDTEVSEPLVGNLDSSFYNSIIMDVEGTMVYLFNLNLDFNGYTNEVAFQRYDGYNKYSAYSFGDRNFKIGDVSAIIDNSTSGGILQTIEYIKSFNDFINNGKEKIFKDRKGNALRVVTTGGVTQAPLDLAISEQPYIVSFHFEEIGDING